MTQPAKTAQLTTTTFGIEHLICPSTGKPFGAKYAGTFTIRRPSLLDKKNIAVRDAASMSFAGEVASGMISNGIVLINYIFAYITTVAEEELPEWFDMSTMFEPQDEEAVTAVWGEVANWLATFRPKADGETGGGAA